MDEIRQKKAFYPKKEKMFEDNLNAIAQNVAKSFYRFVKSNYKDKINKQDIDDIFQETLLEFVKKIRSKEDINFESSSEAFVMGIGKNKLKEFFNKKKLYSDRLKVLLIGNNSPNLDESEAIQEKEAQVKLLIKGMDKLGEECRQLLKLKYWDKKKYSEILEIMPDLGSENNCKQRKHYCLVQLKKIMKDKNKML